MCRTPASQLRLWAAAIPHEHAVTSCTFVPYTSRWHAPLSRSLVAYNVCRGAASDCSTGPPPALATHMPHFKFFTHRARTYSTWALPCKARSHQQ